MRSPVTWAVKRACDAAFASLSLVVLAPVLAVVAALVRIRLGTPVLFRQRRPGLHGEPFVLYKFRTMTEYDGEDPSSATDQERLTPLGRRLRRWSLDELPELWNVVRGDMSLVGPRPLLMQYLDRYDDRQARRHEVRPGITGWAQVHGRNDQSWHERLELDVWYVDHWSLALDATILVRTVSMVLSGRGVSARGHDTMPEFLGTSEPREHARG